jgi:hypothetical protein
MALLRYLKDGDRAATLFDINLARRFISLPSAPPQSSDSSHLLITDWARSRLFLSFIRLESNRVASLFTNLICVVLNKL